MSAIKEPPVMSANIIGGDSVRTIGATATQSHYNTGALPRQPRVVPAGTIATLPHSDEAERALLGSALIDPSVPACVELAPDAFWDSRHKIIWTAIRAVTEDGRESNYVNVGDWLVSRQMYGDAGGSSYLAGLMSDPTAIVAGAPDYAAIIADKARRRALIGVGTEIAAAANNGHDLAGDAERWLRQIETLQAGNDKQIADPWHAFTLADAYAPRPPLATIVDGVLTVPSLSIVYGAPGTLKSFFLVDLSACVAAGRAWLETVPGALGAPKGTTQTPVLWLDFDNGARRSHERFEAIGRAYNLPDDCPLFYYSMPAPRLDASRPESVSQLAARAQAYGASLIVIDNLGLISGDADENSADMVHVMGNLRQLAESANAAVVVIHHQRKGNGVAGRTGETLRGHSSIEAAIDLALLVEREDGAPEVTVRSTKTRDIDVAPFGATFAYEHRPGTNELQSARFWGVAINDNRSDRAIETAIIDTLEAGEANQTKIVSTVREMLNSEPGVNRVRGVLDRMARDHRLEVEVKNHGARVYKISA